MTEMPDRPATRLSQYASIVRPMAEMMPRPVMTTRRRGSLSNAVAAGAGACSARAARRRSSAPKRILDGLGHAVDLQHSVTEGRIRAESCGEPRAHPVPLTGRQVKVCQGISHVCLHVRRRTLGGPRGGPRNESQPGRKAAYAAAAAHGLCRPE